MLKITGPVVRRKQYDRVPMTDGYGPVTAIVRRKWAYYRPKGGTAEEHRVRAALIAREVGGIIEVGSEHTHDNPVYGVVVTFEEEG